MCSYDHAWAYVHRQAGQVEKVSVPQLPQPGHLYAPFNLVFACITWACGQGASITRACLGEHALNQQVLKAHTLEHRMLETHVLREHVLNGHTLGEPKGVPVSVLLLALPGAPAASDTVAAAPGPEGTATQLAPSISDARQQDGAHLLPSGFGSLQNESAVCPTMRPWTLDCHPWCLPSYLRLALMMVMHGAHASQKQSPSVRQSIWGRLIILSKKLRT
eukprot:scaffold101011_cov20-Tisochrysis_lutea.AAC.1